MAEITAAAVKALREMTDLPMMACKKALQEADGDQDKAIEILREEAGKIQLKRSDNATSEGRITVLTSDDGSDTVMLEVVCESAPVAGGEDLVNFSNTCAVQLLANPEVNTVEELLALPSEKSAGKTLNDDFMDMLNKIREKIVVSQIARAKAPCGSYVHHDGKTGVLFQAAGDAADAELLRGVAMHIAALKPTVVKEDELDSAVVEEERNRLIEEAKATGKPDNIIEKIVDGRMKTFFVEQGVLVYQPFAVDDSKTVSQALAEKGLEAVSFTRWAIGG
ncbi:translation elongation factor Ts [Gimesia panareensis]|uniref:Elongation factor Ts n=1 Tax=Gimesia panareensis TaxID=2527978 RepID=A0A517Q982_9PLAN|nr:translation elongation factor Ts [Gimesia panareensis]QDT28184.1 Elongation factor Ts [Gimesia panareensis]QDU51051.1 Elongation factor Ts [Gimesia panareensis]